jgi:anion-transporting  ArsA/GET3 family ATPase
LNHLPGSVEARAAVASRETDLQALLRRLVFVTGKGGTGKTTFAAALARALSKTGHEVLVTMSEPKERLSELFGTRAIGPEVTRIGPGISAVNIDPKEALREYGEMTLKSRLLSHAVFGNRYVPSFFTAVPGLHQWAILGKAWFHSTERTRSGKARFDAVILDAPATGHALEMLWVPKIITEVAHGGVLMRDAERAWRMLRDPNHTAIVALTLPEEVPVTETLELSESLASELGLRLARVVVNNVVPRRFSENEALALADLDVNQLGPRVAPLARVLVDRAATEVVQRTSIARLESALSVPRIELPRLLRAANLPASIDELSEVIAAR